MSYGQCIAPGCKSRGIRASKDCVIPDSTFRYLCPSAATPIGKVHDGCRNRIRKATPAKRAELWRQYQAEQSSADDSDAESTSSSLPEEITAASTSMTATVVPQLHSAFDHPNFWRTHPQRYVAPTSIRSLIPYANPEHTLVIPVDVTVAHMPRLASVPAASIAPLAKSLSSSSSSSSLPSPPPPRGEKRKRLPSPSSPLLRNSPVIAAAAVCSNHRPLSAVLPQSFTSKRTRRLHTVPLSTSFNRVVPLYNWLNTYSSHTPSSSVVLFPDRLLTLHSTAMSMLQQTRRKRIHHHHLITLSTAAIRMKTISNHPYSRTSIIPKQQFTLKRSKQTISPILVKATSSSFSSSAVISLPPPSPLLQHVIFHEFIHLCASGESHVFQIICRSSSTDSLDSNVTAAAASSSSSFIHFVVKHYTCLATHRQESSIFRHLERRLTSTQLTLFVRQRLIPSASLHQQIATAMYARYGLRGMSRSNPEYGITLQLLTDIYKRELPPSTKGSHGATIQAAALDLAQMNKNRLAARMTPPITADSQIKQQRDNNFLAQYCSFFAFYHGVLSDAIYSRTKNDLRSQLRRQWFWQSMKDQEMIPDVKAMANKSLRFVLHCLEALSAHHTCGVLLGDIKPSNLFYQFSLQQQQQQDCRPVFGDYGHASHVGYDPMSEVDHGRIVRSVMDRDAIPANQDTHLRQLVGTIPHGIGTWPYQAYETLVTVPANDKRGKHGGQIFDVSSDGYALAMTIIEVLIGVQCQAHSIDNETQREAYAADSTQLYAHMQQHAAPLYAPLEQLTCIRHHWQHTREQYAILPRKITEQLLLLMHPQRDQRPSLRQVITAIQAQIE